MYNFKRLIKKYSKYNKIISINKVGSFVDMENGGVVIDKTEELEIEGALINKEETIRYDDGGFGKELVFKLYTYNNLPRGSTIVVDDEYKYTIISEIDKSKYDKGLHIYRLECGK